ncbi:MULTISPECIES: C39 family peptidase [Clostridia]|jgi:uncharacterized protein YvpB|uniref:C39 family peptidase n=1 Tax=Clostridia TaxID=186801 RepID=UPI000E5D2886|nr:C39 family peptidase [Eubacterium sp. AF22-9]RGS33488.1 hypothetical protein DWY02_04085 [Eubacterium sp. AF22-9]HAS05711.1 hypothetical protein [Eubacterium sp.]HCO36241.1 hypothetical protein [Eubacterium sp.]
MRKIHLIILAVLIAFMAAACYVPGADSSENESKVQVVVEDAQIDAPVARRVRVEEKGIDYYFPDRKPDDTDWIASSTNVEYDENEYLLALQEAESSYIEGITLVDQFPDLPTGCEVTALEMALKYEGYDVDRFKLCDEYLDKSDTGTGNPFKSFIGNPRSKNGLGCYAQAITECARNAGAQAVNISECKFSEILKYVNDGNPVIIWATVAMKPSTIGSVKWYNADNVLVKYNGQEHCIVLAGMNLDKRKVYIADPYYGKIMEYDMHTFYQRWAEQYKQAVVVY